MGIDKIEELEKINGIGSKTVKELKKRGFRGQLEYEGGEDEYNINELSESVLRDILTPAIDGPFTNKRLLCGIACLIIEQDKKYIKKYKDNSYDIFEFTEINLYISNIKIVDSSVSSRRGMVRRGICNTKFLNNVEVFNKKKHSQYIATEKETKSENIIGKNTNLDDIENEKIDVGDKFVIVYEYEEEEIYEVIEIKNVNNEGKLDMEIVDSNDKERIGTTDESNITFTCLVNYVTSVDEDKYNNINSCGLRKFDEKILEKFKEETSDNSGDLFELRDGLYVGKERMIKILKDEKEGRRPGRRSRRRRRKNISCLDKEDEEDNDERNYSTEDDRDKNAKERAERRKDDIINRELKKDAINCIIETFLK